MVYFIIEELFLAIWNAIVVRQRDAEEEAKLQRIEKIIADARLTGTPVVVEDRRGAIESFQPAGTASPSPPLDGGR